MDPFGFGAALLAGRGGDSRRNTIGALASPRRAVVPALGGTTGKGTRASPICFQDTPPAVPRQQSRQLPVVKNTSGTVPAMAAAGQRNSTFPTAAGRAAAAPRSYKSDSDSDRDEDVDMHQQERAQRRPTEPPKSRHRVTSSEAVYQGINNIKKSGKYYQKISSKKSPWAYSEADLPKFQKFVAATTSDFENLQDLLPRKELVGTVKQSLFVSETEAARNAKAHMLNHDHILCPLKGCGETLEFQIFPTPSEYPFSNGNILHRDGKLYPAYLVCPSKACSYRCTSWTAAKHLLAIVSPPQ